MEAQKIELPGVPNLWKVAEGLYRSGRPTNEGWFSLLRPGWVELKTIINLEYFNADHPPEPIHLEKIPMVAWWPEKEDVEKFLYIATNPLFTPALVHCQHGSDRTGVMVASYRIFVEGWSKDEALKEMLLPQFGFHEIWGNLIDFVTKDFTEGIDRWDIKLD